MQTIPSIAFSERQRLKLSLRAMAHKLGVPYVTLWRYEQGYTINMFIKKHIDKRIAQLQRRAHGQKAKH